ncbi:MAG: hypothetical protein LQ346_007610 [Caloplaca aetnensis]|nr:MAG: hypothetical protein LQ346_007610 [Caloplaca aetnensis]
MDTSDNARSMSPEEALQYLHEFIDVPSEVQVSGIVAYGWTRAIGYTSARARVSWPRIRILAFLLMVSPRVSSRVIFAGILELKRLERALMALGMPYDEVHASFLRQTNNLFKPFPPLYEMYMISVGRAQEIVTADPGLAVILATRVEDPESLHRYRKMQRPHASIGIGTEPSPSQRTTISRPPPATLGAAEEDGIGGWFSSFINHAAKQIVNQLNRYIPGEGTRLAATHKMLLDKGLYSICIGVFLLELCLGYDPNEKRGASIPPHPYRTYTTLLTLTQCFFSLLQQWDVKHGPSKLAILATCTATIRAVSFILQTSEVIQRYLPPPESQGMWTFLCYTVYYCLVFGAVFAALVLGLCICSDISIWQMRRRIRE